MPDDDEGRQLGRLRDEVLLGRGEPLEHVGALVDTVVADVAPVRTGVRVLARTRLRQELSGDR